MPQFRWPFEVLHGLALWAFLQHHQGFRASQEDHHSVAAHQVLHAGVTLSYIRFEGQRQVSKLLLYRTVRGFDRQICRVCCESDRTGKTGRRIRCTLAR